MSAQNDVVATNLTRQRLHQDRIHVRRLEYCGQRFGYELRRQASYPFTASVTLYAQWTINSYTVTFDANGGTGSMSNQSANYNGATNLTANAFTKTGHTFAGWNTAANGSGTSYADQASYPFTANVTLYAQWTINSYTVTFDANGGTGSMSNQSADYNVAANLTANAFTRTGYTFAGWNTAAAAGTAYADGRQLSPSRPTSRCTRSGRSTATP